MIEFHYKWIQVILATIIWVLWCRKYLIKQNTSYAGWMPDLTPVWVIVPTFFYMLFWIVWLLIFY